VHDESFFGSTKGASNCAASMGARRLRWRRSAREDAPTILKKMEGRSGSENPTTRETPRVKGEDVSNTRPRYLDENTLKHAITTKEESWDW